MRVRVPQLALRESAADGQRMYCIVDAVMRAINNMHTAAAAAAAAVNEHVGNLYQLHDGLQLASS